MNRKDSTLELNPRLADSVNDPASDNKQNPDEMASVLRLIHGSESDQEKAVSLLCTMDLNACHDACQQLLSSPVLLQEFKGELILALIRQKTDSLFTMEKDNVSYRFNPSLLNDPDKTSIILQTRDWLETMLEGNRTFGARFAYQLLDQEILKMLPNDFESYDPKRLAGSIIRLVCREMNDEAGLEAMEKKYYPDGLKPYPLRIETRGKF